MLRWFIITLVIPLALITFTTSQHVGYSVTVQIPGEGRDPTSTTELRATRGPCTCEDGICSCCTGVLMQQFNQKGCVNLSYDPDDFALSVRVSMNDRTVYKNSVSGKNPQPVCVPVPRLPALKMCVKFTNVYLAGRNIHACIDMEGHFFDAQMFKMAFDCVRMGANGVALLKPEDGGGVPDDYDVPDEGPDYDIEGEGSVEEEQVNNNKIKSTTSAPVQTTKFTTTSPKKGTVVTQKVTTIQTASTTAKIKIDTPPTTPLVITELTTPKVTNVPTPTKITTIEFSPDPIPVKRTTQSVTSVKPEQTTEKSKLKLENIGPL